MLPDIVIDTNVLMHAGNPNEPRFGSANKILDLVQESITLLCIDRGFDINETKNRSIIGREYLDNLSFGSKGYAVIVYLLTRQRVVEKDKNPSTREKRIIRTNIRNARDRVFAGVTCNSESRVLVSHDYKDFPGQIRTYLKRKISMNILSSSEACQMF